MTRKMTQPESTMRAGRDNRNGLITAAVISSLTLLAVTIIGIWFKTASAPDTGIYRVRVTVLDPQGTPTDQAKVWSSMGGELMKVEGGWHAEIPAAKKPAGGKLIVYASREIPSLVADPVTLTLDKDFNPTATIKLQPPNTVNIRGTIIDKRGKAISGARVFVVGYGEEAVITKDGNFNLPSHKAPDEIVKLYIETSGRSGITWEARAGAENIIIPIN